MRERSELGYFGLVAAVMLVATWLAGPFPERARAAERNEADARKVVARVNGEPIYEDQLEPAVERDLARLARRGAQTDNANLQDRLRARQLNELIGNLLVYQQSKNRTIEDLDEKVEQRAKELERESRAGQRMAGRPKEGRMTRGDSRASLKARVLVDEYLREQGVLEPEIPEDRIREMYDADPESFSTTETVRVRHILIAVDGQAGTEERQQARQKAERIRQEILAGEDFGAMAKEHSDCSTASNGGDLGYIKRGSMPAAFDEVAFALEENTVGEVVETKFGYHVVEALDRQPSRLVPYEQMRTFLMTYLQDEESKKRLAAHIAELRASSEIEILLK